MRRRVVLPALSAAAFACAGLVALRSSSVLFDLRSTLAKYGSAYASGYSYDSNDDNNSQQQRRDAASFSSSSTSSSSTVGDDMNIVLFYADDWTIKTLGIFNDKVLTPNLDAMAERGMAFTHNSVTTSLCWQSRATKVTGVYKAVHNQSRFWDTYMFDQTVRWSDTLYPKLFSAGYHVGYIGKWHAPLPTEYRRVSFDHFQAYSGSHWRRRDGRMRHITDLNGEDALAYLRKHIQKKEEEEDGGSEKDPKAAGSTHGGGRSGPPRRRKFALTVAFFATHAQDYSKWPNGYEPDNFTQPLYKNTSGTYPRPPSATQQAWGDMPWFFTDNNEGRRRWKLRFDTEDHRQESVERIYRMATEVDKVVGDVMDEVKKMGVYDNTLFMFTTDNGVFHGEHGLADKWYPHDESIRVPLIIQDPRMPDHLKGTLNHEFTLNLDLAPTLLSAAGVQVPQHMQGRDIADLYLGDYKTNRMEWRKDFFYEYSQGRAEDAEGHASEDRVPAVFALVRKDYKYFYWPRRKYEQLFHIASDPYEQRDVVNSTDPSLLDEIKARYAYLKNRSQSGFPV